LGRDTRWTIAFRKMFKKTLTPAGRFERVPPHTE
jgi:hypothetical protein